MSALAARTYCRFGKKDFDAFRGFPVHPRPEERIVCHDSRDIHRLPQLIVPRRLLNPAIVGRGSVVIGGDEGFANAQRRPLAKLRIAGKQWLASVKAPRDGELLMSNQKTLHLGRIDLEIFETYFHLNSPGLHLALEADAAGELDTALNRLQAVCLFNKLYMLNFENRIMRELAPFGADKIERYFEIDDTGARAHYVIETLGKEKAAQIVRETADETREQAKNGQIDKESAAPHRAMQPPET